MSLRRSSLAKVKINKRKKATRSNTLPPGKLKAQLNQLNDALFVSVRIRPMKESDETHYFAMKNTLVDKKTGAAFEFARVFDQDVNNMTIYEEVGLPLVNKAVNGFNATVFAYGQTFAGKTHTIQGYGDEKGLIPLSVHALFDKISDNNERVYLVRVSYVEIYNEEIFDLLASTAHQNRSKLELREQKKEFVLPNVTEQICSTAPDVLRVMNKGVANRRVGVSNVHEQSSRSHSIFRIVIESSERDANGAPNGPVRVSQLNFVDLAGSELLVLDSSKKQKKEAAHINLSLTQLKSVITALSQHEKYIPYRNSVLTKMLRESIGGNSKTALICCVYTDKEHDRMTRSTLHFGSMAKTIINKSKINEFYNDKEQTILLQQYQRKIVELEAQLADYEDIQREKRMIQEEFKRLQQQVNALEEKERAQQYHDQSMKQMRGNVIHWDDFLEMKRQGTEYVTPGGPDDDDSNAPLIVGLSEDAMFQLANQLSMLTHENAMLEERLQRELDYADKKQEENNRKIEIEDVNNNETSNNNNNNNNVNKNNNKPQRHIDEKIVEENRQKAIEAAEKVDWSNDFSSILKMNDDTDEAKKIKANKLKKVCDEYIAFQKLAEEPTEWIPKRQKGGFHDRKNQNGQSMIWVAASNGQDKVVRFLLDARVNADEMDEYGKTPLWIATFNSQVDCVRALLEPKATINLTDKDGQTPLHVCAANSNIDDIEIMTLLISSKANLELRNNKKQTPLWIATANNNISGMKVLLKNHANKEAKDINGNAPLSVAALNGHGEALKLLLDAGSLVIQARNARGQTPLHLACSEGGQKSTVKILLESDVAPVLLAAKDKNGFTALMTLCIYETNDDDNNNNENNGEDDDEEDIPYNRKVFEMLLSAGASINDLRTSWNKVMRMYRQLIMKSDLPQCRDLIEDIRKESLAQVMNKIKLPEKEIQRCLMRHSYHVEDTIQALSRSS